jgi:hypothetical protein
MYKQIINFHTKQIVPVIERLTDGATIPFDPDNTDYQEYLKWVAEGNEPLPADEQLGSQ